VAVVIVVTGGVVAVRLISEDAACADVAGVPASAAAALAEQCGVEVELESERTPWVSFFARPDGTTRMTVSAVPEQTNVNGVWEDLNTDVSATPWSGGSGAAGGGSAGQGTSGALFASAELVAPPGVVGMLPVTAPLAPMWVNPGGAAGAGMPLGVVQSGAEWVKMWFPLPLPVPELDERFVTYPLSSGVRLVVAIGADGSGFRPIVELDSPTAAAWFAGELASARADGGLPGSGVQIPYRVQSSEGLQLRGVDGVGFEFVDAADAVVFWAPPSTMWDSAAGGSATGSVAGRTEFPLPGDRTAVMGVEVTETVDGGDVVVLAPDEQMLASEDTVWPVRIDPSLGTRTPVEWVAIRTGGFTSPIYKWTDTATRNGESMGACYLSWTSACGTNFTSRLVWEFGGDLGSWFSTLNGSDIVSASFTADPTNRGNCASTRTDAYFVSAITATQRTWSTLPFNTYLSNVTAPQGDPCSDAGVRREWNVLSGVSSAANSNASSISIGLRANVESNSNGYKTYRADARLTIVYNRPPAKPTDVKLDSPVAACVSGASRPVIGVTTPTLSATLTDPDAGATVRAHFQIITPGTGAEVWNSGTLAAKAAPATFTATVPTGTLVNGGTYQYRVTSYDGLAWSGWSTATCEFKVDTTLPAQPTITPGATGVAAVYAEGQERGGVGLAGTFTLSRGSTASVKLFRYSFTGTPEQTATLDAAGNPVVVSFAPTTTGTVVLTVRAENAQGLLSPARTYTFRVASPKEDAIWMLDEGAGAGAADSSGVTPAQALTTQGATWTTGPHELFASRAGDHALMFDGVAAQASAGPVVDTTASFAVSAFVWLDSAALGAGKVTAISQDGVAQSGFDLSYLPACPTMPSGCWSVGMTDSDANGAAATTVTSPVPVTADSWVHLVAAHDAVAQRMTLWVCEIGTPDHPGAGTPTPTSADRTATPWRAAGAFVLGRGQADGAASNWWPGRIDNVRVYSGQVVADAKIRRLCQGAEATAFTADEAALDPTTTSGE
jgi:hypothetical protein